MLVRERSDYFKNSHIIYFLFSLTQITITYSRMKLKHSISSTRTAEGALDFIIYAVARPATWKLQVEWTWIAAILIVLVIVRGFITVIRVRLNDRHLVYAECVQLLFPTWILWHSLSELSLLMDGKEGCNLFVVAVMQIESVREDWIKLMMHWRRSINSPVIALVLDQSLTLDVARERQSIDWNQWRFLEVLSLLFFVFGNEMSR